GRGDSLRVRFERIRPNRTRGVTGGLVAPNVVDPGFVPELGPRNSEDWWELDLERGTARLHDPPPGLQSLGELPLDPMLGCFGVAPPQGQAISCATSGEHGGNMDYRGFREGVVVDFPVFAEGGLLHVGDGHALQGDGEIVGTGIEVSMDVELTVEVLKGKAICWPRAEDESFVMAVGNARPLAEAAVDAGADLVELGFPFSDPLADGPVIRRAAERALAEGMRTGACLELLAETRARLPETPLVPMTYSSLLEAYGWERFAEEAC